MNAPHFPAKDRYRLEVAGTVQGIGFRPFIYGLAVQHHLTGFVFNHDRGVTIEVEGDPSALERFVVQIRKQAPAASRIDSLSHQSVPIQNSVGFEILASPAASSDKFVSISPDLGLCAECSREVWDPSNRRYLYPFINCTHCGPRFTIIKDVPYDRPLTTMAAFPMCKRCQAEYDDPLNRRFHAQPNACPDCGPQLELLDRSGQSVVPPQAALQHCVELLKSGHLLAIKGIGGFHLACDACNPQAVATLRNRKIREDKPFAVLFPTVDSARPYVKINKTEEEVLLSRANPIVLLEKIPDTMRKNPIAPEVAPKNRWLGTLLPYTPLHELLAKMFNGPLVLTSGNKSDEPIVVSNASALEQLQDIADYFLMHNRDIHTRCDDSVVQVTHNRLNFIRRSRGYAPEAIQTKDSFETQILGVGPHLKSTFCLTREAHALLSHHIGDLDNLAALESFESGITHFQNLFNIRPQAIAHDLHPDYLSTQWVRENFSNRLPKDKIFPVQHHHAHLAACLEENNCSEPALGIALDGTGYGSDGQLWGGEILLADRRDFKRLGRLRPLPLPGGESAIHHPWRIALACLYEAFPRADHENMITESLLFHGIAPKERNIIYSLLDKKRQTPWTSSCGRLFDAVSALVGVTRDAHYDGQAAIELERALPADLNDSPLSEPFIVQQQGELLELDWRPVIKTIATYLATNTQSADMQAAEMSFYFHQALVQALAMGIEQIASRLNEDNPSLPPLKTVALSGGCFHNRFLRSRLTQQLENLGFRVIFHQKVPTNDGGISFGQVVVANQILKGAKSCVWQYR